jgi:hypothetical protein
MPHYTDYRCTVCNQITLRDLLVVKKVVFQPLGAGTKILKSRTVSWLCDECVELDEDYKREAFNGPSHKSPSLERVRAAQAGQETS